MSHSKEHNRKKEEAMRESMEHHKHATVTGLRDGRDHESHKMGDMKRDDRMAGRESGSAGDMGTADKMSMGY